MSNEPQLRVLLVDDDEDCLLFVREAIEDMRACVVHEVTSGAEALDFLYQRGTHQDAPQVCLVYLDVEMPTMHGQDVLKAIRADKRFEAVPVVMMTAVRDDTEMRLAARNGANSYVVKPHDATDFADAIVSSTTYWLHTHARPHRNGGYGCM